MGFNSGFKGLIQISILSSHLCLYLSSGFLHSGHNGKPCIHFSPSLWTNV